MTYQYLCGAGIEIKCTIYFSFTYFYFVEKGGGSALNIFSIFYTHHQIPNKHDDN